MSVPSFQSTYSVRVQDPQSELDEVRSKICDFLIPHHLQINNKGRPIELTLSYTRLQSLFFCYFNYQAESTVEVDELNDHYIIEMPLSGMSETIRGRERFVSKRGQAVVVSPGTHFRTQWNENCTKVLTFINRATIEQQLSQVLDETIREPIQFDLGFNLRARNGSAWWRTMQYIFAELHYQGSNSSLSVHQNRHFEQMLSWSLILHHQSNYSARLERHCDLAQPAFLGRTESFIHDRCAEDITVEQLANIAGVSVPRLFSAFRKHKGISPINYVTNIRFERVHKALKNAGPGSRVSDIAMEWGFYQLGRFSQEYKRRYGEMPSETLRN